jgi:dipeptidyl aminopeptidase/acylaminoacyl peptidase
LRLGLVAITTGLALAAGCTSSEAEPVGDPGGRGRLLVLGEEGAITTILPDGSHPIELAPAGMTRTQPTWSPDGQRVAWTEAGDDHPPSLVVAAATGRELSRDPSPFMAVYISWDPRGERIALSGIDPESGDQLLALADPGKSLEVIDRGAPMWLDWSEDGSRLLAHIEDRFEVVTVEDGARTAVPASGRFRVGIHSGDDLVFAQGEEVGEVLVLGSSDGTVHRQLLRMGSPTAFVSDPNTRRLAVMSLPSPSTLALSREAPGPVPILESNRLVVVDLGDGGLAEVVRGRAVAWFWSPGGDRLLYCTLRLDDSTLSWQVWDGEESVGYQSFIPTGIFGRDYLAYFDQFARSVRFWAPDGSAFVYAGGSSLEDRGIWVQTLGEAMPVRVSAGEVAVWSPGS